jgi:hypothetical protein
VGAVSVAEELQATGATAISAAAGAAVSAIPAAVVAQEALVERPLRIGDAGQCSNAESAALPFVDDCPLVAAAEAAADREEDAAEDDTLLALAEPDAAINMQLRNIPTFYMRDMVLQLLDAYGFTGSYDFLHVPVDFSTGVGLGYATINMLTAASAKLLRQALQGFSQWGAPSECVCDVAVLEEQQSLEEHIDRYRDSPVMHPSLPDWMKPALFTFGGVRMPFPPPRKPIRRPRIRQLKAMRQGFTPPCLDHNASHPLFLDGLV